MSTTTAVVRAAVAYVKPGSPSSLGARHEALEEAVTRYVHRKQQLRTEGVASEPADAAATLSEAAGLPETTTRAFAKERGVRLIVRSQLAKRRKTS